MSANDGLRIKNGAQRHWIGVATTGSNPSERATSSPNFVPSSPNLTKGARNGLIQAHLPGPYFSTRDLHGLLHHIDVVFPGALDARLDALHRILEVWQVDQPLPRFGEVLLENAFIGWTRRRSKAPNWPGPGSRAASHAYYNRTYFKKPGIRPQRSMPLQANGT